MIDLFGNLNKIFNRIGAPVAVSISADIAAIKGETAGITTETEVIENHVHPHLSVTTPNGRLRVAALTFNSAATNNQTVTLGKAGGTSIVYTYKDVLGAPAVGNCQILAQATPKLTAQMLAAPHATCR